MSYVLHFDLADILAMVDEVNVGDEAIYLQDYQTTASSHGLPSHVTSQIVMTYKDRGMNIHAARIVIETASLLRSRDEQHAVAHALQARAAQAVRLVRAHLPGDWIRRGMLLEPGLYDDLKTIETSHDLWSWTGDQKDVLARELVPSGEKKERNR